MAAAVGAVKGADNYLGGDRLQRHHAGAGAAVGHGWSPTCSRILWAPFLMCLVLTGIHAYLGVHVLAREVVFVDIALAQIAALGRDRGVPVRLRDWTPGSRTRAGWPRRSWARSSWRSRGAARAARLAGGGDRRRLRGVLGGGAVLLADRAAHGAEQVRGDARRQPARGGGRARSRRSRRSTRAIGAAALGLPAPVLPDLDRSRRRAYAAGWRVRLWDFLFYASFGVVVTSSVRIAGVLLVFSYLIVPALAGDRPRRLGHGEAVHRLGVRHAGQRARDGGLGGASTCRRAPPSSARSALTLSVFGLAFRLGWLRTAPLGP